MRCVSVFTASAVYQFLYTYFLNEKTISALIRNLKDLDMDSIIPVSDVSRVWIWSLVRIDFVGPFGAY